MSEVFISYARADRNLIEPIAVRLDALSVEAWLDTRISPGDDFLEDIHSKLKEVRLVLVCWSPNAIQSKWVKGEAHWAFEHRVYLPVYVAPCELMPPFNLVETVDLSSWANSPNDPGWLSLVAQIGHLTGREGLAAAARALGSGDKAALNEIARRYPNEPAAEKVLSDWRYDRLYSHNNTYLLKMIDLSFQFRSLFLMSSSPFGASIRLRPRDEWKSAVGEVLRELKSLDAQGEEVSATPQMLMSIFGSDSDVLQTLTKRYWSYADLKTKLVKAAGAMLAEAQPSDATWEAFNYTLSRFRWVNKDTSVAFTSAALQHLERELEVE